MLGAVRWRAVQHGLARLVRTRWRLAVGDTEWCRVQNRGWKCAVQEGLEGTVQKPDPEYRDGASRGTELLLWP